MKNKKWLSYILAGLIMLTLNFGNTVISSPSSKSNFAAVSRNITITGSNASIPNEILQIISERIVEKDVLDKYNSYLQERASFYNLTSNELFELMLNTLTPPEQNKMLELYAGKTIELTYEQGSLLLSTGG